jgi:putative transposase
MKEWLTAREIAAEKLPDMPTTESAVIRLADREGWAATSAARRREGRGGATEYHVSLLPVLAQAAYSQRHLKVDLANDNAAAAGRKPAPAAGVTARAGEERDARLAIVNAFKKFLPKLGYASRVQVFCDRYNAGSTEVAGFVRETVPSISKRSLARWVQAAKKGKLVGHDPAAARKGTGVLDTANSGAVKRFVLALIAHQPHLSAHHVRTLCRDEFGDAVKAVSKGVEKAIPMPPVRTFQHALAGWKEAHKVELLKITNPDLYRSTLAPAGVGTLRHVTEANQLWQIDASPVDALCVDGRHSIYCCIDIATRRMIFFVSRTPRASAVAMLMRKAIIAWGVPELVKTDNGSDFTARDTARLFASLGIETQLSDPYQPQQKGHVERGIGTFQRDVGPLLPGFIGHSVTDRKAIESRKSFAARLGESDAETFGVQLSGPALQKHIDEWALTAYSHAPHAGLKGGTPFKAALASTAPIRRVDERALDLLLMPVAGGDGRRRTTKFGIRIDHHQYQTPTVLPGLDVFVRQDPNDLGRALLFEEGGGRFLGEAFCPELSGIDPQAYMAEAKAMRRELVDERTKQIRDDARKLAKGPALIERVLNVARRDAPNVIALPKREETHTTAQISAAIEAMGERLNPTRELTPREAAEHRRLIDEMTRDEEARLDRDVQAKLFARRAEIEAARIAHLPKDEKVVALPETPKERFRRARLFERQCEEETIRAADALWLGGYQLSPEYKAHKEMHEDFGDAWLES